ncbi:hypothetical protein [Ideonella alba]|uniref:Uncharacterized protein n=1 Tax=Ideonella alba TaxID=2824118 RepID=A0A941BCM0_9BURK|nr:hypothetical protein [Ideonella alba]MBQ0929296.1 hypothetical protein [Ideonella alba]
MTPHFARRLGVLTLAALLLAGAARADEADAGGPRLSWSAFGTIGLTQSDQSFTYQRFIKDHATAERDSVLGVQLDAQFSPEWSATVQLRLGPSEDHDARWSLRPSWAFVAWRPDNDWLLRLGRMRVPFFLRSEQLDVGQTYDEARLPTEFYSLAPTSDFNGLNLSRSLWLADGELSIDGYVGQTTLAKRSWQREAVPSPVPGQAPLVSAGPQFRSADVDALGGVLTWRTADTTLRAGLHRLTVGLSDGSGLLVRPVWAPLGPGLGYWQTSNQLPGPGVQEARHFREWLYAVGVDHRFDERWRVAAELMRLRQSGTVMAVDAWAAAATVSRQWGAFTPYVSLAAAHSTADGTAVARALDSTRLPDALPGAPLLNGSMRSAADQTLIFRQTSLALGSSWALDARSKLKLEWMHTQAQQSQLIDVPAGEPLARPRHVNVLSLSYSFVY